MSKCDICKKGIGLFSTEYVCALCGNHICSDCRYRWKEHSSILSQILNVEEVDSFFHGSYLPVCPNCIRKMENNCKRVEEAMNNSYDVEIVSINYQGKKMYLSNSKRNIQSHSYRNRDDAREELCVIAKYFGCDMILDFEYERIECEEDSDSGKGIHKYSEWSCSGIAVKKCRTRFLGFTSVPVP